MNFYDNLNTVVLRASAANQVAQINKTKHQSLMELGFVLSMIALFFVVPCVAHAQQPWESTAQKTYELIMSIARWVAIIAVVACGLAAIFGKLSWDWAGKIIIGLVLIFGGTFLVDYFKSGMGA